MPVSYQTIEVKKIRSLAQVNESFMKSGHIGRLSFNYDSWILCHDSGAQGIRNFPTCVICALYHLTWLRVPQLDAWRSKLEDDLRRIAAQHSRAWEVRCHHIEHVKTYSPHVLHVVADVQCSLK